MGTEAEQAGVSNGPVSLRVVIHVASEVRALGGPNASALSLSLCLIALLWRGEREQGDPENADHSALRRSERSGEGLDRFGVKPQSVFVRSRGPSGTGVDWSHNHQSYRRYEVFVKRTILTSLWGGRTADEPPK